MKQKISPTSPKTAIQKKQPNTGIGSSDGKGSPFRQTTSSFGMLHIIFISLLGIIGGFLAVFVFFSQSEYFGIFADSSTQQPQVIIRNGAEQSRYQEDFLKAFVSNASPSIVHVFAADIASTVTKISEARLTQDQFTGYGALLTRDGVGVAPLSVFPESVPTFIAITHDGIAHTLRITHRDSVSGLSFFTLSGSDFAPADIVEADAVVPVTSLISLHRPFASQTYVVRDESVWSLSTQANTEIISEDFFENLSLQEKHEYPKGTPLYRADGALYGFFDGDNENPKLVSLAERRPVVDQYLETKEIVYPFLGVSGFDLQSVWLRFETKASEGFYVTSVTADSPADKAGIKTEDVIVRIGDNNLNKTQKLGKLIRGFSVGEIVTIVIERAGTEQTISATLSEL